MKAVVVRSLHASSARIAHQARQRGTDVSASNVRRRLSNDFNLVARRPAKKPMTSVKQLRTHVAFVSHLQTNRLIGALSLPMDVADLKSSTKE
jgi:hypothetical protein